MPDYYMPLHPDNIYHVFNRAVGNEKLFRQERNYEFFLSKYLKHILPIADTYSYCLLPNHFHFLIRMKCLENIEAHYLKMKKDKKFSLEIVPDFLMERFSNLFNSYTKAYNKIYDRKGALFIDYLKRVELKDEAQFGATIFYIHKNPVHHQYRKKIDEWKWSSYPSLISASPTNLLRSDVINWFGDEEAFIRYHQQQIDIKHAIIIE